MGAWPTLNNIEVIFHPQIFRSFSNYNNKQGKYVPYFDKDPQLLIDVIKYSMINCPNWIRLPRVIRDIPCSVYVSGGNNIGNMRQVIDNMLNGENNYSKDINFEMIDISCINLDSLDRTDELYGILHNRSNYKEGAPGRLPYLPLCELPHHFDVSKT